MKLLRDLIAVLNRLVDAIFVLADAVSWKEQTEFVNSDEKFQKLMEKIYSEPPQEEEIPPVEGENSLPTAEIVEFSPSAADSEALREEMLEYLRDRGVVVDGKTSAEVELEVLQQLGIPRSALNLMGWSGRD